MPKGMPNKKYSGEYKQMVVETMRKEGLSYKEAERRFDLAHRRAADRERIYLEEGLEGLYVERRSRKSIGGPPKQFKPEAEEDLIAEVQRVKSGECILKKWKALVLEEEHQSKRHK